MQELKINVQFLLYSFPTQIHQSSLYLDVIEPMTPKTSFQEHLTSSPEEFDMHDVLPSSPFHLVQMKYPSMVDKMTCIRNTITNQILCNKKIKTHTRIVMEVSE
uniref:Uncharacterized protein LOC105115191 isoform X1 n=1 Tax=Rhizophora mucronata TaxID=61149 RepID=A0A2P2JYW6_RHIMU